MISRETNRSGSSQCSTCFDTAQAAAVNAEEQYQQQPGQRKPTQEKPQTQTRAQTRSSPAQERLSRPPTGSRTTQPRKYHNLPHREGQLTSRRDGTDKVQKWLWPVQFLGWCPLVLGSVALAGGTRSWVKALVPTFTQCRRYVHRSPGPPGCAHTKPVGPCASAALLVSLWAVFADVQLVPALPGGSAKTTGQLKHS